MHESLFELFGTTISQNPLIKVFFFTLIGVFFDQFSCCSDVSLSHIDECTADESYNNVGKNLDYTTLIFGCYLT